MIRERTYTVRLRIIYNGHNARLMHDHVTVIIFTLITIVVHQNLSTSVTLASFGKISHRHNPMVWGIFSWHTLGPLVPTEHRLNATAYLSIVADHVHLFMTTVYPSSDATSSRIMHHVTKLKSSQTGFLNMTMSSLSSNGLHSHQI